MRLEMANFPITRVRLGSSPRYQNGSLEVDQEELIALVLQDKRVEEASLAVVVPGEKVRVTGIRDVVEPRVKVQGEGQVFPGILGPVAPVGDGRTHRLSGMAVLAAAEYEGTIRAGLGVQRSAILDMWGPGADISRFQASDSRDTTSSRRSSSNPKPIPITSSSTPAKARVSCSRVATGKTIALARATPTR